MAQENCDFFALPHEGPSSPRDDRHEHPWSLRRVYRFFWPRISLPPFHQIPAVDMEVSVDNGVETTWSGISSSRVVDSMHTPSPARWADITPARVHFMRINMWGAHHDPFDLPFHDLMQEDFTSLLNVSIRRPLFNILSLPPAPSTWMEYNLLIFSLGNLIILLTEEKYLLFFFHTKEPAICTNLSRSIADDILRHAAPYPMNINVYALCFYGYRLMLCQPLMPYL